MIFSFYTKHGLIVLLKLILTGTAASNFFRKFQNKRARRCSGGVALYIRNSIVNGVSVVRNHFDSVIWLKLDQSFFHLDSDVFVSGIYIWPENSPMYNVVNVDFFTLLQNDIAEFHSLGKVFIIGDWNSRTGSRADYICM